VLPKDYHGAKGRYLGTIPLKAVNGKELKLKNH
jgi:hypothetical protein